MPLSLSCLNLPVVTVSGRSLGRVVGVEVDPTGQRVVCYQVAPVVAPLGGLWHHKLLVYPAQVVKITSESMVVEDNAVRTSAATEPDLIATSTT